MTRLTGTRILSDFDMVAIGNRGLGLQMLGAGANAEAHDGVADDGRAGLASTSAQELHPIKITDHEAV